MRSRIPTRQISALILLVALGVVVRIGVAGFGLMASPLHGILAKVGLTETLTVACGLAFGPLQGFITGALIIVVSDLYMMPGPWTPFIAAIIGLLGIVGGVLGRFRENPGPIFMTVIAVVLTLMSEILQNVWFALFFGLPIVAVLVIGATSIVSALINNTVLFPTLGLKTIKILREKVG